MQAVGFNIHGPLLLTPNTHEDERGTFRETFRQSNIVSLTGENITFVQENFAASHLKNTIRGLHYQAPPQAQGKLITCLSGLIRDVIVDVRRESSTYGQHISVDLDSTLGQQFWVPAGFLHGYACLANDCQVLYKVSAYYNPALEGSIRWDDKDLAIDWGVDTGAAILSNKDRDASFFKEFSSPY